MSETALKPEIVRSPGICGGRPRIAGTRITVDHLVSYARILDDAAPVRLRRAFPHLTPAGIDAAFNYYESNPEEIEAIIQRQEEELIREGQSPHQAVPGRS